MGWIHYLEEFNLLSVVVRLILATAFGGCIGWERASKGRDAGLRTFALVAMGSAMAMITNEYLYTQYGTAVDPTRMAAQVISGIGFLGAGSIIVTGRKHVVGLTTASSLWASSAMGIAFGAGYLWGGVLAFFIIMISVWLLQFISTHQEETNRHMDLYVEVSGHEGYEEMVTYFTQNSFEIRSIEKQRKQKTIYDDDIGFNLEIYRGKTFPHKEVLDALRRMDYVHYTEENG